MKIKLPRASLLDLNAEQAAALVRFARFEGRYWKAKLVNRWARGLTDGPYLQQIRNDYGPEWLYNLPASEIKEY